MRRRLAFLVFLVGLAFVVAPHLRLVLADIRSGELIASYDAAVAAQPATKLAESLEHATRAASPGGYYDPFRGGVREEPSRVTTLNDDGVFGYLEIPRIGERLPLYLGATAAHLLQGVAQIQGTSLPIGGVGTHAVIAGHRGYFGTPYFRHLDQLQVGDHFTLQVYGRELTYRVTGQDVILPTETDRLAADPEKDQVTLLTCTPFGSATHRLLVHAERVDAAAQPQTRDIPAQPLAAPHRALSWAVLGFGTAAWLAVFVLLARTFRRTRHSEGVPPSLPDQWV